MKHRQMLHAYHSQSFKPRAARVTPIVKIHRNARARTVCAPVLPHAIPVTGPLSDWPDTGLPEEAVAHPHALHIAAAREPQKPAAQINST